MSPRTIRDRTSLNLEPLEAREVPAGGTLGSLTGPITLPPPTFPTPARVSWNLGVGYLTGSYGKVRVFSDATHYSEFTVATNLWSGEEVRVAMGDVNGDGAMDAVVTTSATNVIDVYDGRTFSQSAPAKLASFNPSKFGRSYFVSTGDFDRDGKADIVVSDAERKGETTVLNTELYVCMATRVLAGHAQLVSPLSPFFGYTDGYRTATGDVNGDKTPDLVVTTWVGGAPRVAVYDGRTMLSASPTRLCQDFFAYDINDRNGSDVAVVDINGDGYGEVLVGQQGASLTQQRVTNKLFSVDGKKLMTTGPVVTEPAPSLPGHHGIRLAVRNIDGDTKKDLFVAYRFSQTIHTLTGYSGYFSSGFTRGPDFNPFLGQPDAGPVWVG